MCTGLPPTSPGPQVHTSVYKVIVMVWLVRDFRADIPLLLLIARNIILIKPRETMSFIS